MTSKKKSHRLQVVKPAATAGTSDAPPVYGTLVITSLEAQLGTRKLVNVTAGSKKRLFRVTVPPGSRDGTILRLAGAGEQLQDGTQGNLYLRVTVR